jgi:hypothetical protein
MATFRFPYRPYRGQRAPVVPVRILADGRWRRIFAYVDSGAAYSVLTQSEARRLGLLGIKARRLAVTTSGGQVYQISLHRLWAKLGPQRLSITFGVPRGFDIDFNLLGRRDIFERFTVCFDETHGWVTFTPQPKR